MLSGSWRLAGARNAAACGEHRWRTIHVPARRSLGARCPQRGESWCWGSLLGWGAGTVVFFQKADIQSRQIHKTTLTSLPWGGGRPGRCNVVPVVCSLDGAEEGGHPREHGVPAVLGPGPQALACCRGWGGLAWGLEALRGAHAAVPCQASSPQDLRLFYERNKTLVPT